jgi:hypothetical protein
MGVGASVAADDGTNVGPGVVDDSPERKKMLP